MESGIYKITSPSNKIYIGQAIDITKRWAKYKRLNCKRQPKLYNSFIKYSVEKHLFEVIEYCDIEQLNTRERYWQDFYDVVNTGLNCVLQNSEDKPRLFSLEMRQKRRDWQTGKSMSAETREKLSLANKGKIYSEENKASRKGKQTGVNHGLSKRILDTSTGVIYSCIREASETLNLNYSSLRRSLCGIRPNKTSLIYC